MNRMKKPSFLKVFERADEKDDRPLFTDNSSEHDDIETTPPTTTTTTTTAGASGSLENDDDYNDDLYAPPPEFTSSISMTLPTLPTEPPLLTSSRSSTFPTTAAAAAAKLQVAGNRKGQSVLNKGVSGGFRTFHKTREKPKTNKQEPSSSASEDDADDDNDEYGDNDNDDDHDDNDNAEEDEDENHKDDDDEEGQEETAERDGDAAAATGTANESDNGPYNYNNNNNHDPTPNQNHVRQQRRSSLTGGFRGLFTKGKSRLSKRNLLASQSTLQTDFLQDSNAVYGSNSNNSIPSAPALQRAVTSPMPTTATTLSPTSSTMEFSNKSKEPRTGNGVESRLEENDNDKDDDDDDDDDNNDDDDDDDGATRQTCSETSSPTKKKERKWLSSSENNSRHNSNSNQKGDSNNNNNNNQDHAANNHELSRSTSHTRRGSFLGSGTGRRGQKSNNNHSSNKSCAPSPTHQADQHLLYDSDQGASSTSDDLGVDHWTSNSKNKKNEKVTLLSTSSMLPQKEPSSSSASPNKKQKPPVLSAPSGEIDATSPVCSPLSPKTPKSMMRKKNSRSTKEEEQQQQHYAEIEVFQHSPSKKSTTLSRKKMGSTSKKSPKPLSNSRGNASSAASMSSHAMAAGPTGTQQVQATHEYEAAVMQIAGNDGAKPFAQITLEMTPRGSAGSKPSLGGKRGGAGAVPAGLPFLSSLSTHADANNNNSNKKSSTGTPPSALEKTAGAHDNLLASPLRLLKGKVSAQSHYFVNPAALQASADMLPLSADQLNNGELGMFENDDDDDDDDDNDDSSDQESFARSMESHSEHNKSTATKQQQSSLPSKAQPSPGSGRGYSTHTNTSSMGTTINTQLDRSSFHSFGSSIDDNNDLMEQGDDMQEESQKFIVDATGVVVATMPAALARASMVIPEEDGVDDTTNHSAELSGDAAAPAVKKSSMPVEKRSAGVYSQTLNDVQNGTTKKDEPTSSRSPYSDSRRHGPSASRDGDGFGTADIDPSTPVHSSGNSVPSIGSDKKKNALQHDQESRTESKTRSDKALAVSSGKESSSAHHSSPHSREPRDNKQQPHKRSGTGNKSSDDNHQHKSSASSREKDSSSHGQSPRRKDTRHSHGMEERASSSPTSPRKRYNSHDGRQPSPRKERSKSFDRAEKSVSSPDKHKNQDGTDEDGLSAGKRRSDRDRDNTQRTPRQKSDHKSTDQHYSSTEKNKSSRSGSDRKHHEGDRHSHENSDTKRDHNSKSADEREHHSPKKTTDLRRQEDPKYKSRSTEQRSQGSSGTSDSVRAEARASLKGEKVQKNQDSELLRDERRKMLRGEPGNKSSRGLTQKEGYEREGVERDASKPSGKSERSLKRHDDDGYNEKKRRSCDKSFSKSPRPKPKDKASGSRPRIASSDVAAVDGVLVTAAAAGKKTSEGKDGLDSDLPQLIPLDSMDLENDVVSSQEGHKDNNQAQGEKTRNSNPVSKSAHQRSTLVTSVDSHGDFESNKGATTNADEVGGSSSDCRGRHNDAEADKMIRSKADARLASDLPLPTSNGRDLLTDIRITNEMKNQKNSCATQEIGVSPATGTILPSKADSPSQTPENSAPRLSTSLPDSLKSNDFGLTAPSEASLFQSTGTLVDDNMKKIKRSPTTPGTPHSGTKTAKVQSVVNWERIPSPSSLKDSLVRESPAKSGLESPLSASRTTNAKKSHSPSGRRRSLISNVPDRLTEEAGKSPVRRLMSPSSRPEAKCMSPLDRPGTNTSIQQLRPPLSVTRAEKKKSASSIRRRSSISNVPSPSMMKTGTIEISWRRSPSPYVSKGTLSALDCKSTMENLKSPLLDEMEATPGSPISRAQDSLSNKKRETPIDDSKPRPRGDVRKTDDKICNGQVSGRVETRPRDKNTYYTKNSVDKKGKEVGESMRGGHANETTYSLRKQEELAKDSKESKSKENSHDFSKANRTHSETGRVDGHAVRADKQPSMKEKSHEKGNEAGTISRYTSDHAGRNNKSASNVDEKVSATDERISNRQHGMESPVKASPSSRRASMSGAITGTRNAASSRRLRDSVDHEQNDHSTFDAVGQKTDTCKAHDRATATTVVTGHEAQAFSGKEACSHEGRRTSKSTVEYSIPGEGHVSIEDKNRQGAELCKQKPKNKCVSSPTNDEGKCNSIAVGERSSHSLIKLDENGKNRMNMSTELSITNEFYFDNHNEEKEITTSSPEEPEQFKAAKMPTIGDADDEDSVRSRDQMNGDVLLSPCIDASHETPQDVEAIDDSREAPSFSEALDSGGVVAFDITDQNTALPQHLPGSETIATMKSLAITDVSCALSVGDDESVSNMDYAKTAVVIRDDRTVPKEEATVTNESTQGESNNARANGGILPENGVDEQHLTVTAADTTSSNTEDSLRFENVVSSREEEEEEEMTGTSSQRRIDAAEFVKVQQIDLINACPTGTNSAHTATWGLQDGGDDQIDKEYNKLSLEVAESRVRLELARSKVKDLEGDIENLLQQLETLQKRKQDRSRMIVS